MIEDLPEDKSFLFIVSGPAGSGKTTLCDRMIEELSPRVQRVITATTRKPREGEKEGVDYYFLSEEDFKETIATEGFYEHATVHGRSYGTLKEEVQRKLGQNIDLLLNIDVQGASTFRKAAETDPLLQGRVVSIFIIPEDEKELKKRLSGRGQDDEDEIERRLAVALEEVQRWREYNYYIPSRSKEEDFACLMSLYAAEKLKVRR